MKQRPSVTGFIIQIAIVCVLASGWCANAFAQDLSSESRRFLQQLDDATVRAVWAEWVRIALSSAGNIDTVDLDDMVSRTGGAIAVAIRQRACPDAAERADVEAAALRAARQSIDPHKHRGVPDDDLIRVAVASGELAYRAGSALCIAGELEALLFP